MKIYILTFFILFVSIIVILKLITSPEPVTSPEISRDMKRYEKGKSTYQNNDEAYYKQSMIEEADDLKLLAFAKAFVDVQSYMHKAGNKASYNETSKIVKNHGLSVEVYTRIASRMNENSDFQNKIQEMINDVN